MGARELRHVSDEQFVERERVDVLRSNHLWNGVGYADRHRSYHALRELVDRVAVLVRGWDGQVRDDDRVAPVDRVGKDDVVPVGELLDIRFSPDVVGAFVDPSLNRSAGAVEGS